ncbi:restriction endonuclease subunit S [Streptomyces sp. NPDC005951]|uniref:restriction endonuclease subunit S n=1 Tax=Streptomyces sp. NPDC005951 TaxID=3154573 RepID=UPI0033EA1A9B
MSESRVAPWLASSRWATVPIRLVARLGSGHTPSRSKPEYWEGCTIPWITLADVWQLRSGQIRVIAETKEKISPLGVANSAAVEHPAGTVILSRTASVGFSAIMGSEMATSQDFATWTCGPKLDHRYLLYTLRGMAPDLKRIAMGSTHKTIYMPDIEQLKIPLPPPEEQQRIADFLDAEVGKLDAIVRSRSQQYELLNERIDSQVLRIIGRSELGDPDSGESLAAMRWLLRKVTRPTAHTSEVVTAFRDGQVTARSLRRADGYTNSASAEPQGQHVLAGDVVVHGLDGFAGAIGTSEAAGNCSPVNHVMFPQGEGDSLYYGRLLRILALQGYLTGFSHSTRERAFDFRNWDMFGRIPIPVASVDEQRRIGKQIKTVRPLRGKLDLFSERIAERRQALVTAAVTGQFDVSTASGRNVTEGITA